MPPPRQGPDAMVDVTFPLGGTDVSHGLDGQPPQTTPEALNVRAFESLTGRARGGSRPALGRYILGHLPPGAPLPPPAAPPRARITLDQLAGGQLIQHVTYIVDPSGKATFDPVDWSLPVVHLDWVPDPSSPDEFGWRNGGDPVRLVPDGGDGGWLIRSLTRSPRILWDDPADVVVGTVLDDTQLNARAVDPDTGEPIGGTYDYTPPAGTVLDTVTASLPLVVVFTPDATLAWRPATKTVHVHVIRATIVFIQAAPQGGGEFETDGTEGSLTFGAPVAAGDTIFVLIFAAGGAFATGTDGAPGRMESVSDSLGNVYTRAGAYLDGDGVNVVPCFSLSWWYARSATAGVCTVTAVTDAVCFELLMAAAAYSGVKPTGPLDATAQATSQDGDSSAACGPLAIAGAGELALLGLWGIADLELSFSGGVNARYPVPNPDGALVLLDQIGPAAGSVTITVTDDDEFTPEFDPFWVMASFKPAGG